MVMKPNLSCHHCSHNVPSLSDESFHNKSCIYLTWCPKNSFSIISLFCQKPNNFILFWGATVSWVNFSQCQASNC